MNEPTPIEQLPVHDNDGITHETTAPKKHQFLLMVCGSIVIAIMLVLMSMALYVSSGASQLDLSRPGYESLREQVRGDETFKGFSASGAIDEAALKEFDKLYAEKLQETQAVDAFGKDVLSPESLEIDQASVLKSAQ